MENNNVRTQDLSDNVGKVYKIVMQALLFYTIGCILNCVINSLILTFVGILVSFVSIFALSGSNTEHSKQNYVNLLATALGITGSLLVREAYLMDPLILVGAMVGTFLIFLMFTMMSNFIKDENIVVLGGFLLSSLSGFTLIGLALLFFNQSPTVELAYLIIGLLLFCGYIAYDTKMMYMKFRDPDDEKDHYHHALNLFLDLINIFIKLVKLLMIFSDGNKKKKKDR